MNRRITATIVLGIALVILSTAALAADKAALTHEADDLAKVAQNPLATMVTLPLQSNWNTGVGEYDRTMYNLNIQPVIPFPGEKWNVINRVIMPVNTIPIGEYDSTSGLGDTMWQIFFSPNTEGAVTWGVGPVFNLPTAANQELLGSGKWGAGPTGVIFVSLGKWTFGGVASNIWSFAGDSDREDINRLTAQWFINYNFGGGWALGTVPTVTADWTAESGEQWTVPWGLQLSKVMPIGRQPVNVLVGYYVNSEHPTNGPESQVRFQVNFLFPTPAK